MRKTYRITPRARDDLVSIARYTELKWGKQQRNKYLRQLQARFAWLAKNPMLGKHRPEIVEGYYCYPQGEHVVFYMIQEHTIAIIGIPHQQMDLDSQLKE